MIYIRDCEKDKYWSLTHISKKIENNRKISNYTRTKAHTVLTETTAPTHTHKKFSRAKPQDL